jgi:hypothetical protein
MVDIWSTLIDIQDLFIDNFNLTGIEVYEPNMDRFNQNGWVNRVWASSLYRRAHLDVVDARSTRGIWMMHCCIFPHIHNTAPIYGFDVVAGKNKITGFFHDFSPVNHSHTMIDWFEAETTKLEWVKSRKLPEWAEPIFSQNIITASNISLESEVNQIFEITANSLSFYLKNVGESNNQTVNTSKEQTFYCEQQKQNPHTPKVMINLGLNEEDVHLFINECLFPQIL